MTRVTKILSTGPELLEISHSLSFSLISSLECSPPFLEDTRKSVCATETLKMPWPIEQLGTREKGIQK